MWNILPLNRAKIIISDMACLSSRTYMRWSCAIIHIEMHSNESTFPEFLPPFVYICTVRQQQNVVERAGVYFTVYIRWKPHKIYTFDILGNTTNDWCKCILFLWPFNEPSKISENFPTSNAYFRYCVSIFVAVKHCDKIQLQSINASAQQFKLLKPLKLVRNCFSRGFVVKIRI